MGAYDGVSNPLGRVLPDTSTKKVRPPECLTPVTKIGSDMSQSSRLCDTEVASEVIQRHVLLLQVIRRHVLLCSLGGVDLKMLHSLVDAM